MIDKEEFDPTHCANCAGPLQADYLVIDQGTLSWCLCGWRCLHEFSEHPNSKKAADAARGTLHKAWVRGPIRWHVYRTKQGGMVRKVIEYLIPFRSLAAAVTAAKNEAGENASEIPTRAP